MIISDKKYACETCIKGHRSSSCKHFDRPLFEIKKKGRPITQCEHCRELRKTKQVHVKCICEGNTKPSADPAAQAKLKGNKSGFESAAFPNGLPVQTLGTSVASPTRTAHDSDSGCNCASSGTCGCCIPRKNQTHRRTRTTSSLHPGTSSGGGNPVRIGIAPAADLRPVLPGPPPQQQQQTELFLGAAAPAGHHHDPSRGLYHNYARHDAYSPYGRAYDMHNAGHQPQPPAITTSPPATDSNGMMQQQPFSIPACNCGPGCRCRGCSQSMGVAGGTCSNPDTCSSCLDCSISALQPFLSQQVDPSAGVGDSSIDDWLRSLPEGAPSSSTSATFLDDDLISGPNAFNWDPNIPNITLESDSDFTTASIFRLSGGPGQGYPYLDPNFLDGVRFDTSTELRPRSHSPASAMHLARGGAATLDLDVGLGSSSSSSDGQFAIAAYRRQINMQDGQYNLALNVAGMRSAPQLNQLLLPDISSQMHTSSSVSPVQYAPSSTSDSDTSLRDNLRY